MTRIPIPFTFILRAFTGIIGRTIKNLYVYGGKVSKGEREGIEDASIRIEKNKKKFENRA